MELDVECIFHVLEEDGVAEGVSALLLGGYCKGDALLVKGHVYRIACGGDDLRRIFAEGSVLRILLHHAELGCATVGLLEGGYIVELPGGAVIERYGVGELLLRVAGINLVLTRRGTSEDDVLVRVNHDALHSVVERGHHGGELAREGVGGDDDFGSVAGIGFGIGRDIGPGTAAGIGGDAELTVCGATDEVVRTAIHFIRCIEGLVGVVDQREGGPSDVVGGESESEGLGILNGTARHTACNGHEGLVVEGKSVLVLHELAGLEHGIAAIQDGEGIICLVVVRIALAIDEYVSVLAGSDVVAADGDADGELTVFVGGDVGAVLGTRRAVDTELHALDGNARAIVINGTAHLEGADVLEVHPIVYERLCADETVGFRGGELMHAQ